MAQEHSWDDLMWAEMADLATLLHELPDEEFDTPSLCEGWEVRDVVGHMLLGHTTPMPKMIAMLSHYRFNVTKGSFEESRKFARSLSPEQICTQWDEVVGARTKKGISRVIPAREGYVDHTVHQQDIRRGIDRPREIPEGRLVAALDGVVGLSSPMFAPKKNVSGLRLEATDVDWSHGSGPGVSGSGEAILMAAAGRSVALDDLEGDGVATLADKVASR